MHNKLQLCEKDNNDTKKPPTHESLLHIHSIRPKQISIHGEMEETAKTWRKMHRSSKTRERAKRMDEQ